MTNSEKISRNTLIYTVKIVIFVISNPNIQMIMADHRDSQTMTVGRFPSLQAAELAAGMLRTNGVPCEVGGGTLASVLPLTDTWTPIELIVPQECAARARELLASHGDGQ